jgi:ABC-type nitrate/sulfonate/bicarbonate transport system ATPase subunit
VTKRFGDVVAADGVSLEARPGEVCALLGPSGCGKTTLLSMIAGLLAPDSGSIAIGGERPAPGRAGYMFQKDLLFPWLRLADNVALPLTSRGVRASEARKRALEHFEAFGLAGFERAWPKELSGGMRQRAALLRTLLASSDLVLMDEPFGALDAITRTELRAWLSARLSEAGATAILVTHDVAEAVELADRIYVLTPRPARVSGAVENARKSPSSRERIAAEVVALLEAGR